MKLKKITYLIGLLITCVQLIAQQTGHTIRKIDSLYQLAYRNYSDGKLETAIQYTDEAWRLAQTRDLGYRGIRVLIFQAKIYQQMEVDEKALYSYLNALYELEKIPEDQRNAEVNYELGHLFFEKGIPIKTIEYYSQAIQQYEENDDVDGQVRTLQGLGDAQAALGHHDEALKYYENLLGFYTDRNQQKDVLSTLSLMVDLYKKDQEYTKALGHSEKILKIHQARRDSSAIANSLNNIGYLLFQMEVYEDALDRFKQALSLDDKNRGLDYPPDVSIQTKVNVAICYQNLGKVPEAIYELLMVERWWQGQGNAIEIAKTQNLLALIYLRAGDIHNASQYSRSAVNIAENSQNALLMSDCYETHAEVLQENNDFENALDYYRRHLSVRDSLVRDKQIQEESLILERTNFTRKEQDLKLQISNLELEGLALRRREQAKELEERKNELSELEDKQYIQELELAAQAARSQNQRRELEALQMEQKMQQMQLEAQEQLAIEREAVVLEREKQDATKLQALEAENKYQASEMQKLETRRKYFSGIIGLIVIILILLIIGYIQNRNTTQKLAKQKKAIEQTNRELAYKNKEVEAQSENLKVMNVTLEQKQKETEQAYLRLKDAQTKLVQSEKMASLGQLTAGIAHEINNPINFVSASIKPLSRDFLDIKQLFEAYKKLENSKDMQKDLMKAQELADEIEIDYIIEEMEMLLKGIEDGAVRTKNIVAGLRNFSRLDEDDIKQAQVHEGLDATLVLLQNHTKHRIDIVKNYDEHLPKIDCYPGKLNQVFMNILTNAIQAIEDKGKITIGTKTISGEAKPEIPASGTHAATRPVPQFIEISIADSGKGMPTEVQQRIFDPFFTTKDVGEGTGLGLSISYGIIEQHKGTITVESEEGKGTEFVIRLPLHQS